jgi:hypothetical protein
VDDELYYDSRPQDIGGKPSFSYIENAGICAIMFEMTVFLQRI